MQPNHWMRFPLFFQSFIALWVRICCYMFRDWNTEKLEHKMSKVQQKISELGWEKGIKYIFSWSRNSVPIICVFFSWNNGYGHLEIFTRISSNFHMHIFQDYYKQYVLVSNQSLKIFISGSFKKYLNLTVFYSIFTEHHFSQFNYNWSAQGAISYLAGHISVILYTILEAFQVIFNAQPKLCFKLSKYDQMYHSNLNGMNQFQRSISYE